MGKVILSILLFFTSGITCAQTIENLKTFKEVATFLEKGISKEYTFDAIFEGEEELDEADFNEVVHKVDLDNNGHTDLVIDYIGDMIFILNKGNNKFEEIKMLDISSNWLDESRESFSMKKINDKTLFICETRLSEFDTENSENIIIKENHIDFSHDQRTNELTGFVRDVRIRRDTLEIKFGTFVQFQSTKQTPKNKIKEIHFEATPCYGSCPVFELKLTSDGNLDYYGKRSTNFKGRKKVKLNGAQVEELFGLVAYTNVQNFKDNYAVNETDNPGANLKVVFDNGEIKEIYDYGRSGTYNLRVIYKKLLEISKNIK